MKFFPSILVVIGAFVGAVVGRAAAPTLTNFNAQHFIVDDTGAPTNVLKSNWKLESSVLSPSRGTSVLVTNLTSEQTLTAAGAFIFANSLTTNLVAGVNELNPFRVGSIRVTGFSGTASDASINLSSGHGPGQLIIIENYTAGVGFCITNGTPLWDDPGKEIILPNGDWCPTTEGESVWMLANGHGNWMEVNRINPGGTNVFNTLTINVMNVISNVYYFGNPNPLSAINPTLNYVPYKNGPNSFGDSPWYRISATELGFNGTDQFLASDGAGTVTIGQEALEAATMPTLSTVMGYQAAQNSTGGSVQGLVVIGQRALRANVTGHSDDVVIGNRAAEDSTSGLGNVIIGFSAANDTITINDSVIIGFQAGLIMSSVSQNNVIGSSAMQASTSGNDNTMMGYAVGRFQSGVSGNTAFGSRALYSGTTGFQMVGIGFEAGKSNTVGIGGLYLGYNANPAANNLTNAAAIGNQAMTTNNNQMTLGNATNYYVFPGTSATFSGNLEVIGSSLLSAGVVTNNIGSVLTVGDTTFIDLLKASQTNSVTGALTFAHATNGAHGLEYTHVRWIFVPSGGPHTLTIPSGWRTNVYSAVPPALTNGTITRMVVTSGGPTADAASQTNCYVSFEYYK